MQRVTPPFRLSAPADGFEREEAGISRLEWLIRSITAGLALLAVLFFLATGDKSSWKFIVYPLLAGIPLFYGVASERWLRLMQVALLRRHQARLVLRSAELEEMASRDDLTGLYNRRYFYESVQAELEKARKTREPLALMLVDMDSFKRINDEYGHNVGDVILVNLARVISKHTRNSDAPARLGGDEFGVVMPATDKRGAFALARRLWTELEETPMYEEAGTRVMVNISIGVSGFPWGGEDVDEMMHWADSDMYANKVSRRLPAQPQEEPAKEIDSVMDDYGLGI